MLADDNEMSKSPLKVALLTYLAFAHHDKARARRARRGGAAARRRGGAAAA